MEKVTQSKLKKIEAFFDRNYALFFAPVIVAFIYMFTLWQYDVFPFGDKYTAASYDLSAQICPFIEHLFDVFKGKSTLSFSYAIVGGADVTGTFLYFFISPFSFLFLIFGEGKVAYASSIVLLCKLMTIAVTGVWFAKKQFRDIPDYICLAIGVVYTYCGYTFVSNTYINWMDFLIYLPFCVAAFRHFVKTDKFLPFSILVACCVYTCFSIACFSLFTVYPALIAYAIFCVKKEGRNKFIAYMSLSLVVALLLSLPVLFPALGAYSVSGRGGSIFENLWKGFAVNSETGELGSFSSSKFIDGYSDSLYQKWSYILSDSVFVVLTLIWLTRKGLKDNFAKFMLAAGILTLLPTVVDESMNLLNMGSYMSYALRFGFLNALYFLGGACLCIEGWCYKPFTAYDGASLLAENENLDTKEKEVGRVALNEVLRKENRRLLIWMGVFIGVSLLVAGFLLWFISGNNYLTLMKWFGSDSKGFPSNFSWSRGGLEVIVVPFVCVALVLLVGAFLVSGKKISIRLLSVALIVVVGLQVVFLNEHLVVGTRSTQHINFGHYQTINRQLNEQDDSYFRVKDYNDVMMANIPFTGDGNSFSVFSSVIDADNFVVGELFGYKNNGKNSFKSTHDGNKTGGSEVFGDSFLGYKYVVSNKDDLEKDYLQPFMTTDSEGNSVQLSSGGYYVYENTTVLPLGYRVQRGGFTLPQPNTNNISYRKQNQKALYRYLRGKDMTTDTLTATGAKELRNYLNDRAAQVTVSAGKITANVIADENEDLLLNFVAAKGYSVTVNGKKAQLVDNDLKFLLVELKKGENKVVFTYTSPYGKYAAIGAFVAIVALLAVAFIVKRTKIMEYVSPVIAWTGISLALVVIAFFMLYPTGVFLAKVIELLKGWLL